MEETKEEWKGFIIVRSGRFWRIRNGLVYVGGMFTDYNKAKQWVDARVINDKEKEFNKAVRELKKEPDLGKRQRKYKKLCQNKSST